MSVALLIKQIDNQAVNIYAPVAAQRYFDAVWQPIIEQHGFEWLTFFQSGASFTEADYPFIMKELQQFEQICRTEIPDEEHLFTRLHLMLEHLHKLEGKPCEFWIG